MPPEAPPSNSEIIYAGEALKLVGPRPHTRRVILLDTIIRSYVFNPNIELLNDGTIRYAVHRDYRVQYHINNEPELENHVNYSRHDVFSTMSVWLRPNDCRNCGDPWYQHVGDKCLFASTKWEE